MADYITSTSMSLVVPVSGVTVGPDWANDINASLVIIDQHDHSTGKGVPVTPAGMNINADLPYGGNNANSVRTVRFSNPASQPTGSSDLNCIYAYGGNLYFNNGATPVQITVGSSVAGSAGSISGLSSPASATYVSLSNSFVWQSAANTPAYLDGASLILRNFSANSKGLTLNPPAAMAADFAITLPALPVSGTSVVTLDSSGAMGTTQPDGSTIVNSGGVLSVGTISGSNVIGGFGLVPTGGVIPYGGTSAPTGYLLCDGTSYLRASYSALFTAIGTAYGAADGTHFNVPDMRGLFMRGVSGASSNDPDKTTRTALNTGGNTGNNVGSYQADQVGPHSNTMPGGAVGGGTTGNPQHVVQSDATGLTMTTDVSSTSETRPKNVYFNFIIKT